MIRSILHKLNLIPLTWARGRIRCPSEIILPGSRRESVWELPDFNSVFDGTVNRCRENIIKIAHHDPVPVTAFEDAEIRNITSEFRYEVIRLAPWRRTFLQPHGRTLFKELSKEACRELFAEFADVGEIWISDPFYTYQKVLVPQRWRWSYRKILNYLWMKLLKRPIDWNKFPHEIRDRWDFTMGIGREGS